MRCAKRSPPGSERRYGVKLDPATEVLPVNGTREALFAFAQASVDSSRHGRRVVISPNPFYQIYEGAALLAGATPLLPQHPAGKRLHAWTVAACRKTSGNSVNWSTSARPATPPAR